MNILHITTFLQGGAGRIIADLACYQVTSGHNVTVTTTGRQVQDYGNYPQWLDRLTSARVNLLLVESTFKRDVSLNIAAFRQILESIDCASLSLIHTHAAIPSLVALLLRSRAQRPLPILQTMHGWGIQKNPEQAATDVTLMNQLDRIITPSEASKRLLIRLGLNPKLVAVLPYGVAPSPSGVEGQATQLLHQWRSRGLRILLCLGTVGARKNQRLLLEAMAHPQAPLNLACAIVGEGEEVPALEAMAQESGIADRVHFFGYQAEASTFLKAADWLVLPSNDEGLPLSILEAYRAGVPVLGSDIPEIAEIIEPDKTGILFHVGNLDSLVAALSRLANMSVVEHRKIGDALKKLWKEHYSLERMLKQYDQLYLELLAKKCCTP